MVLIAVGSVIKCFVVHGFYLVLIGQCVSAIGLPFLLNAQTKIITNWFPEKEVVESNNVVRFLTV